MHTKFADETKFWEGREALQKDLDELEGWMITKYAKFKKCKCQILHLGWGNPGYLYRLTDEKLESSPKGRNVGVLVGDNLNQSSSVHCSPKNQSWGASGPGLPARRGEGLSYYAMCCCSTGCFGLGITMSEGQKSTGEYPNQSYADGEGYKDKTYEDQLRSLVCSALRRLRGRLRAACRGAKGQY